jgi:cytochrome c553
MFKHQVVSAILFCLFAVNAHAVDAVDGQNRSIICQGCHGASGNNTNQGVPNLAGQSAAYLEAQLNAFKAGARQNPVMKSMAAEIEAEDIQDIAAYYARQKTGSAGGDASLAALGKSRAVMCMGCHGEKFEGQGARPRLAGQHPEYLNKQLHDFTSSARIGAPMNAIAKSLGDEDIKAIAAYLGSLGK